MKETTIGSYIRTLRLKNGLTQMALAKRLHVTDKAVSKWERDLSIPDIRLLPNLAEALGVTLGDVIKEFDRGEAPQRWVKQYEVSSDLRTPLHIIIGCTDLVETYRDDEEKFHRYLDAIRISGEYLLSALSTLNGESGQVTERLEELLSEKASEKKNAAVSYDFTGRRILVAEDIAVNREIAAGLLVPTGAEIAFAEDGQVCVHMIEENPAGYFDMILMDLMMPNMNGIEAAKRVRSLEEKEKAEIPIIAMTANVDPEDREAAFAAGMNAFTEKPIDTKQLFSEIERYLRPKP